MKIGVGQLRKADDKPYSFTGQYEIVKAGDWKIDIGEDFIEFGQQLGGDRGWAYQYTKRIELLENPPGFVMRHRLRNTGTRAIDTTWYNHNFTLIDDTPIGPDYRVIFPFEPHPIEGQLAPPGQFRGREIVFAGAIPDGRALWVAFDGFKTAADNAVTIRNDKTQAAIEIAGDQTPIRAVYFGTNTCACPEMFIPIKLEPGQEKQWMLRYTLS